MKELLKDKKKLAIVIIAIVIIVAILGVTMYKDQFNKKQLQILSAEAEKLNSLNLETDEIDMEIKSKGKYAVVEQTMKDYLNETRTTCKELVDLCSNSDLDKLLSAENIEADGPEFTATKEKLNTFRTQVNEYIEKCNNLINEDNINNAINDKNVGEKFEKIYRDIMISGVSEISSLNKTKQSLNSSAEQINKSLDKMDNILNFLSDNKDSWELKGGKIQFTNISKLTEYYKVVNER